MTGVRVLLSPRVSAGVSALGSPPRLQGSCLSVWYSTICVTLSQSLPTLSQCLHVWVSLSLCVSASVWSVGFPSSLYPFTTVFLMPIRCMRYSEFSLWFVEM